MRRFFVFLIFFVIGLQIGLGPKDQRLQAQLNSLHFKARPIRAPSSSGQKVTVEQALLGSPTGPSAPLTSDVPYSYSSSSSDDDDNNNSSNSSLWMYLPLFLPVAMYGLGFLFNSFSHWSDDSNKAAVGAIDRANETVKGVYEPPIPCADCDAAIAGKEASDTTGGLQKIKPPGAVDAIVTQVPLAPLGEEEICPATPLRPENPSQRVMALQCEVRKETYQACAREGDGSRVSLFQLWNKGPNDIVKAPNSYRKYEFSFEQMAVQDLHFSVEDSSGGPESLPQKSDFYIFPRKLTPSIQKDDQQKNANQGAGGRTWVSLPNGERMVFDKNNKIVGGAFANESSVGQGSPSLKYQGKSVLVRVDKKAGSQGPPKVTVQKGAKVCSNDKVQALFSDNSFSGKHFPFASDEVFNKRLMETCGFSIYGEP